VCRFGWNWSSDQFHPNLHTWRSPT